MVRAVAHWYLKGDRFFCNAQPRLFGRASSAFPVVTGEFASKSGPRSWNCHVSEPQRRDVGGNPAPTGLALSVTTVAFPVTDVAFSVTDVAFSVTSVATPVTQGSHKPLCNMRKIMGCPAF